MILEMEMSKDLLEAFLQEVRTKNLPVHIQRSFLPVHIQRSFPYTDENGTEMERVIIEHPDTDFDFNAVLGRVINEHYNLKES